MDNNQLMMQNQQEDIKKNKWNIFFIVFFVLLSFWIFYSYFPILVIAFKTLIFAMLVVASFGLILIIDENFNKNYEKYFTYQSIGWLYISAIIVAIIIIAFAISAICYYSLSKKIKRPTKITCLTLGSIYLTLELIALCANIVILATLPR
ncbi:hypothetical protein PT313_01900 [Metamycoplasma hyosynoviae]|uniref:Transmembrane protein n=1 Tax=Metamycoplasma hyosynoviae TaxID=29559 RepID=A0A063YDV3_9BACT|nr:hypothetical protein [Metamycoplasma hyosynoviae]KDE42871.1 hypothetical protein NPL1_02595 [Metamycoplasma hyosynoviae]MDC8911848.1 hypothetical protein [Metamycoplasma hyosynoviae]MDC8914409.1 hypothetical protein [Metamycoplasma hyosynoviae]MDC8915633.1 hypothetical protein [Metamycoplasma hyosynoviae]MDC8921821.1 hypothetical protein [Metamycoplasma hyosynoviae]